MRTKILSDIKQHLKKFPSIHDAWTFDEVAQQKTREHDIKNYFNNSLFAGRSGDIQFQIKRYCFVSKYDKGTSHSSPYDYTTHVPLIVYLPGKTKQTTITVPVTMMQVAPTLAQFFSINPPSASNVSPLPDLPLH